jgi:hypothetical protein
MFSYEDFKVATAQERSVLISNEAEKIICPDGFTAQLEFAYRASKVINQIIDEHIDNQLRNDASLKHGSALQNENFIAATNKIFDDFRPLAEQKISELRPTVEELKAKPKNLYELVGATELAFANRVSRNISTTMGPLWELVANISPYAVNPETEFGVKIVGVDLVLKNAQSGQIEYAQLKTQKNTLTGSQSGRADSELSLHDNPIFCACFDTKPSWTYNSQKNIPKYCGPEFWNRIDIDYDLVVSSLDRLFSSLERSFVKMLNSN